MLSVQTLVSVDSVHAFGLRVFETFDAGSEGPLERAQLIFVVFGQRLALLLL